MCVGNLRIFAFASTIGSRLLVSRADADPIATTYCRLLAFAASHTISSLANRTAASQSVGFFALEAAYSRHDGDFPICAASTGAIIHFIFFFAADAVCYELFVFFTASVNIIEY